MTAYMPPQMKEMVSNSFWLFNAVWGIVTIASTFSSSKLDIAYNVGIWAAANVIFATIMWFVNQSRDTRTHEDAN